MPDDDSVLRAELAAFEATDLALLGRSTITALTGMRGSNLDDAVRRGAFPAPIRVSHRMRRWPAAALRKWLAETAATPTP